MATHLVPFLDFGLISAQHRAAVWSPHSAAVWSPRRVAVWSPHSGSVEPTQWLCGAHTVSLCGAHTVAVRAAGGRVKGGRANSNLTGLAQDCYPMLQVVRPLGSLEPHFLGVLGVSSEP